MNGQTWKTEAELFKITSFLTSMIISFTVLAITVNATFDLKWSRVYSTCLNRIDMTQPAVLELCINGLRIICVISTVVVDIKTLVLVRRFRNGPSQVQQEDRHIMNEIPMRSSLFNLSLLLIPFIGHILQIHGYRLALQSEDRIRQVMIIHLSIFLFKSPFITFLTYRVNDTNARIDQDEERERKRQIEIQEAKQRRNERIARQLAMQSHDGKHFNFLL